MVFVRDLQSKWNLKWCAKQVLWCISLTRRGPFFYLRMIVTASQEMAVLIELLLKLLLKFQNQNFSTLCREINWKVPGWSYLVTVQWWGWLAKVLWSNYEIHSDQGLSEWIWEMPIYCGLLRQKMEKQSYSSTDLFSNCMTGESAGKKNENTILPGKGEVWSLYKNWSPEI
jgi:hypothetical protein